MIWALSIVVFLGGVFVPPGTLDSALGSILVTFFGLVSAGILPAISLLVGNTLSASFSIKKLDELKLELEQLIQKLLQTLGFLVAGALLIMTLEIGVPDLPPQVLNLQLPKWLCTSPTRILQSGTLVAFLVGLDRLRLVGSAFRRVLIERYELARIDSTARTRLNTSSIGKMDTVFPKPSSFGSKVYVKDDQSTEQE